MHRTLRDILAHRQLFNAMTTARQGVETDIFDRLTPEAEEDWDAIRTSFTTLRCRIRAEYLPSNYPNHPLLAFVVEPIDPMPTTKPVMSNVPWHVSIAFYYPQFDREFTRVHRRYLMAREVVLRGHIQGSSFELHPNSPIANDADVVALHQNGHYRHRDLHLSL